MIFYALFWFFGVISLFSGKYEVALACFMCAFIADISETNMRLSNNLIDIKKELSEIKQLLKKSFDEY